MIQLLLLLAVIGILVARAFVNPDRSEEFSNPEEPEDTDDPRDLPWIASWSAADRAARQGHNCAVKFTDQGEDGMTIITTSKSCEAGMPHTRAGDRIIIPDSIPEPLRADILAHERIHIYQRRHPEEWRTFYRRNWSFEFHPGPPAGLPEQIVRARRGNPDTWSPASGGPWACWMGRYWPIPVYTHPDRPSLRDAVTVWWDAQLRRVLMEPPDAWTSFFGRQSQDEHPHELAAVLIVSEDRLTEAGRRIMNWWNSQGVLMRARR